MSRIVVTGGPGAGKTTLLLALQARGYTIVGDSARTIIQDRRRRGLSPRPSAYEFTREVLRMTSRTLFITLRPQATSSLIEASSMLFARSITSHP
jgi:predicted ATPase